MPGPRRTPLLLGALVVVLLVCGPGLLSEGLVGSSGGEIYGHAWVQWWHAEALPAWPSGTELARGADPWPVIDPLPTALAAGITRLAGVGPGYDAWLALSVLGAFLGGAWLARQEGGSAWVGGLCLALAPAFVGSLNSGLTEDGALGLAAVGLGLVGRPGWRTGLLSGLALGLLAWCGLVLAFLTGLAALGLGLGALARAGERRREVLASLLLGALLAGLLAAPLAWVHADRLGGAGHRAGQWVAQVEPLWRLNPWKGADLASFLVPGRQDPGAALVRTHPAYLGLLPLGLALLGGWSRWWAVLGGALVLAPGPWLSLAGQPLAENPVHAVLSELPGLSLLNHHGRALLVGALALSVLAARGAARLEPRLPALGGSLLAGLVALELGLLSPLALPLGSVDITPPEIVRPCPESETETDADGDADPACVGLEDLPAGALLVLPAAGPGVHFQRPLLDQRVHGRPLLRSPNQPGLPPELQRSPTGRWLAGLAFTDEAPPAALVLPGELAAVVVMEPWVDRAATGLGPPQRRTSDGALWDVRRLGSPEDAGGNAP